MLNCPMHTQHKQMQTALFETNLGLGSSFLQCHSHLKRDPFSDSILMDKGLGNHQCSKHEGFKHPRHKEGPSKAGILDDLNCKDPHKS